MEYFSPKISVFSGKERTKFDTVTVLVEHIGLCFNFYRSEAYVECMFDKYYKIFVPRIGK